MDSRDETLKPLGVTARITVISGPILALGLGLTLGVGRDHNYQSAGVMLIGLVFSMDRAIRILTSRLSESGVADAVAGAAILASWWFAFQFGYA